MEDPIVEIDDGKLRGIIKKDFNGENYYAFLGVPYGKPPLGELRFKAPLPVEPWEGIKNVIQDSEPCCQVELVRDKTYVGSEDCLYMNVFTKSLTDSKPLKPVLVFFHGGGFIMGANKTRSYLPTFLMKEDIVFVAVNYRVGVLGFLRLDDATLEVPGNAGLKDQILALRWIQKNIEKFGGDPKNVTISGESAGGASVNYHILSPSSKGLFHKAIMQSGCVLNPWPHLNPKYLDIMKYLNKICSSDKEILDTLRNIPAQELIQAQYNWMQELEDSKFRWFAPCEEKPNPTAFLTTKPIDLITSGNYNKVPVIIGYNSNEGLFNLFDEEENEKIAKGLVIPQQILLPDDAKRKEELLKKTKNLYSSEKYRNNPYLPSGDSMMAAGINGLAQNLAKTSSEPIYFYIFDLVASRNIFRRLLNIGDQYPGASHIDELGYLFDNQMFHDTPIIPGSVEDNAIRRFVKLWVNFMQYGNPTPDHEELNFTWKPVTTDKFYYLHFNEELSVKTNPEEDRMLLWREIYKSHEETKDYMP